MQREQQIRVDAAQPLSHTCTIVTGVTSTPMEGGQMALGGTDLNLLLPLKVLLEEGNHLFHVGFCIEQADNVGITPQASFARQWLKYRRVMRILEGDGDRAGFHQRIAKVFGICAGCIQF